MQNLEGKERLEILRKSQRPSGQQAKRGMVASSMRDSEVGMQAGNVERMQEDSGCHAQDVSPRYQERVPLTESSRNLHV